MFSLRGDFGFSPRIRIYAAALASTGFIALPAGLMGWVAASGMDFIFEMQSSKPIWWLPLWCLIFFCFALKHFAFEEKIRTTKHFEARWGKTEEKVPLAA
jgi:hypothetical protein